MKQTQQKAITVIAIIELLIKNNTKEDRHEIIEYIRDYFLEN